MSDALDQRLTLADDVLDAVDRLQPGVASIVALALQLDGGSLRRVGAAIASAGDGCVELARLQLAHELRRLASFGDAELLDRLAAAELQPWVALSTAVTAAQS